MGFPATYRIASRGRACDRRFSAPRGGRIFKMRSGRLLRPAGAGIASRSQTIGGARDDQELIQPAGGAASTIGSAPARKTSGAGNERPTSFGRSERKPVSSSRWPDRQGMQQEQEACGPRECRCSSARSAATQRSRFPEATPTTPARDKAAPAAPCMTRAQARSPASNARAIPFDQGVSLSMRPRNR